MESINYFDLQNLQNEIETIINKVLSSSTDLKDVLQKYKVLEATEVQLKVNLSKLGVKEIVANNSAESSLKLDINRLDIQEIAVFKGVWCEVCDDYRAPDKCSAAQCT